MCFRPFILLLLFAACPIVAPAQVLSDSIQVVERKLGYDLYQGNMHIGSNRTRALMKDCPLGLQHFNRGKMSEAAGSLLMAVGAAVGLAAAGNHLAGGQPYTLYPVLLPAVAVFSVGVPLYLSGEKRVRTSVAYYNSRCVK